MLQVQGVDRYFGDHQVLKDVTFNVERGKLTGFVGGNGAGKTTAMRIILGVLGAHGGSVSMNGRPLDAAARRSFGYMPEERGLYPKMRAAEQLAYLARLRGFDLAEAQTRALALV